MALRQHRRATESRGQPTELVRVAPEPFSLERTIAENAGRGMHLHAAHLNPQMPRLLRAIGFDRTYVRGEGPYLYDEAGQRYLDMLAGFGVYALGRNHPTVKRALHAVLDADLADLVQFDAPLLPG